MSTTTVRLDDSLKTRVAAAAQRIGKTPHALILDAIEATVQQAEVDADFERVADQRWARLMATGETVFWTDAKCWLEARAQGKAKAARPPTKRQVR